MDVFDESPGLPDFTLHRIDDLSETSFHLNGARESNFSEQNRENKLVIIWAA